MGLSSDKLVRDLLRKDKLRAISFSRDSDGKEERLREWRERKGLTHNEREHKRNRFTAAKYELEVVGEVSSVECAADVGRRGEEIVEAARRSGAQVVIVPSLRRLGVGVAQTQLRVAIEAAGLRIVSERETEATVLASESSPSRELILANFAASDEYEWRCNKERLRRARENHRGTERWQVTLDFIEARAHLTHKRLAEILEAHGYRTLTGNERWYAMTVLRARRDVDNRAAGLRTGSGAPKPS